MNKTRIVPHQNTVFRQLANRLPLGVMRRLIARHGADKGVRKLGTERMLLTMLLAQLSEARGLRDITALLESYMIDGHFSATQFLCDVEGHPEQPPLRRALEELAFFSRECRILGVYAAASFRLAQGSGD